jgi:hypothetical protein
LPEPPELCEAPLEPPFADWPDWIEVLELEQAQAVTRATTETIRRTFIGCTGLARRGARGLCASRSKIYPESFHDSLLNHRRPFWSPPFVCC